MLRAEGSRQFLSPAKGLVVVLLLLVLAGAGIVVAQQGADDELPPTGAESNNFALTNPEAIARFEELNTLAIQAVQQRDASLLSKVFTPDGPTGKRASKAIRGLLADKVFDKTRFELINAEVVSNSADEIRIREVSRLYPCFVSESGKDVTDANAIVEQSGTWTLRRLGSTWLVHDVVLTDDRVVKQRAATCG